ncbi:alpha/beta fold hydrolase [Chitinophaga sp. 30R24]|uniref:alpha/beta fold hydrolase n=1 Tax=Chitinophaga sp. 30R24 TaxID=3248838 RepID=UPI003B8F54B4
MDTSQLSGYAPVNGLQMYYEIHGTGKPLILLHGSFMTINLNYGSLIPELAKNHQVIALEMQGHGRTADIDRPFSYPMLADDVAALLQYLKIDQADVLGYSLGATVGLELVIRYPSLVNKLIFISSVYKYEGWTPAAREVYPTIEPEFLSQTPLKAAYDSLAPDKEHWADFVNKLMKFDTSPFDLGTENVKAVKKPVFIISGDNDGVDLQHIATMYNLFGGGVLADMEGLPASRLAIIPGATHVSIMSETDKLLNLINSF